jgi:leucine efflux protein
VFDIQNYASFILAVGVFQVIPGAGTLTILNATARNGVGAGLAAVMGTIAGDFVFMVAAVAGLAAVMHTYPLLFRALQWFGAAYLCWLGIKLLRARLESDSSEQQQRRSPWIYFRQAFAVSLTNPKVILFFVAFFPLFLRVNAPTSTLLVMMFHVTMISLLYQSSLVFVGNAVARRLKSKPSARLIATRIAGFALVGFGLKLATNNR